MSEAPIRRSPWRTRAGNRLWPRATQGLLIAIGLVLAAGTFFVVMRMPDAPYHSARDLELRATYDSYRATGVPLIKQNGTGSSYGQVAGAGNTRAAGDDDPGSYLIASLMSHITKSDSPYPGLRIAMAILVALPLLLLPLVVARIFRSARAGYAMLALPPVTWLINHGTVLIGTEYGLFDQSSPTRVYALYGLAASMVFASLVLVSYLATRRLGWRSLVVWSLVVVVLAASGNLLRSMSGIGIALALVVLWWGQLQGRKWFVRGGLSAASGALAVCGAMLLPGVMMDFVDTRREPVIQQEASALPSSHGLWHPFYLGLSFPEEVNGTPSKFGIVWSDQFGWEKAREVDPDVRIASEEYDAILKDLYLDIVKESPLGVARLYLEKGLFTVKHFAAMLVLIAIGLTIALRRPGAHRDRLRRVVFLTLPTIAIGLLPAVLVMPLLYYFSELVAALGLLTAVALGGLVWGYTSLPSFVRAAERRRLVERGLVASSQADVALSFVIPTRNGEAVLRDTLNQLAGRLRPEDEIVVVENGSTDGTAALIDEIAGSWNHDVELITTTSEPGLGNALRTGAIASRGRRVLLSADDLPFGFTDLEAFEQLPPSALVAIGSKAHPASTVARSLRRTIQSRLFRSMREALLHSSVGDSQGTIWVDGDWVRAFSALSREQGIMWTVELVLAAEQQGEDVWEVPVVLRDEHDAVASRFGARDAWIATRGIARLAMQKDDYVEDDWRELESKMLRLGAAPRI